MNELIHKWSTKTITISIVALVFCCGILVPSTANARQKRPGMCANTCSCATLDQAAEENPEGFQRCANLIRRGESGEGPKHRFICLLGAVSCCRADQPTYCWSVTSSTPSDDPRSQMLPPTQMPPPATQ